MREMPTRCAWTTNDTLYINYHDSEWGIPVYNDKQLFEMLCLEGAQAGLSWITILRRREGYRAAFDGFDAERMAHYSEEQVEALLNDTRIIRNRAKVKAFVKNANALLRLQAEEGTFAAFLWRFVGGVPIVNCPATLAAVPTESDESRAMSKALKLRGFSFVGPTICYAFMQACGLVNDHTVDCFRAKCNTQS